jgi:uncharacterized protein
MASVSAPTASKEEGNANQSTNGNGDRIYIDRVLQEVERFYRENPQIKESHGLEHVLAVFDHSQMAIACCAPPLTETEAMEVSVASLLHDVDDVKYFPSVEIPYNNAKTQMNKARIPSTSRDCILTMIELVSCSKNGNTVPSFIKETEKYHLLIPRWSDRLESIGKIGVVRCYLYSKENSRPLSRDQSPRAINVDQLWEYASPERFEAYQSRGGSSNDMISHYYDKLLHVARPPNDIVRNPHLEEQAEKSALPLIEVCLRFGRTGVVDEDYILGLWEPTARN